MTRDSLDLHSLLLKFCWQKQWCNITDDDDKFFVSLRHQYRCCPTEKWLKTFLNDAKRNKFAVNPINLNHLKKFYNIWKWLTKRTWDIPLWKHQLQWNRAFSWRMYLWVFFLKLGPNIFQCNVLEITQLFVYFTFLLFIGFRTPIYASFSELNLSVLTEVRQIRVRFYFQTSL